MNTQNDLLKEVTSAICTATVRGGPRISTGKDSVQDVGTPWEFIHACQERFGTIVADLAATAENRKAEQFISPEEDSFRVNWSYRWSGSICWLNPPFSDIAPWAGKCAAESKLGVKILFLVPASIDSNWWAESVHGKALVLPLHPRIKFVGSKDLYPKPLALVEYGFGEVGYPGRWKWK